LGVCIALDDFGVGYNSYNCIRNIPLDIIKIDKSYIHDMRRNDVSKYIIESIISLANTLKMKVIAEGIENKKDALYLYRQGVCYMQGYYFSPALKGEDFIKKWLITV
ncbi:EAL domain-containing protein, partial [Escherichia coli]|uniref:EAL domain-containing protein n=1 Tax=Escherichia coli TaxID=562 RepID=UPI0020250F9C